MKKVHNTRSQVLGNTRLDLRYLSLNGEKRIDLSGGTENEPGVEMKESGIISLGCGFEEKMCPCECKAETDYFPGNRLDRRFRIEGIVQESTKNAFKHVRRETIEFE